MKKYRILVVDDEPINLELISSFLKDNYEVVTVDNGEAAIKIVSQSPGEIDVIVLDVNMPVKNGFEVCQELIDAHPNHRMNSKIMFFTAQEAHVREKSREFGCSYLMKPGSKDNLLGAIEKILQVLN
jgi:CheY-like chemotaxis protein